VTDAKAAFDELLYWIAGRSPVQGFSIDTPTRLINTNYLPEAAMPAIRSRQKPGNCWERVLPMPQWYVGKRNSAK